MASIDTVNIISSAILNLEGLPNNASCLLIFIDNLTLNECEDMLVLESEEV
jgi:hypothetical protein